MDFHDVDALSNRNEMLHLETQVDIRVSFIASTFTSFPIITTLGFESFLGVMFFSLSVVTLARRRVLT
jgi:hypothetical protein